MRLARLQPAHIFLTGVTGFVGKVVLFELLRRRGELQVAKIHVLIRSHKKGGDAEERFQKEVVASPCFAKLESGWTDLVEVVRGELTERDCGILPAEQSRLAKNITHIINCAASVDFDLPLANAAAANITSSLNVLEFARTCAALERMVNISTAYVSPHKSDESPISEELVALPFAASDIYHQILNGEVNERELMQQTGHPNTYTLTKCLSEHLLFERKGSIPLTIVRPSIISACWQQPFPAWIDSQAAFAGFVALIGMGYLRAVVAQYATFLDVVPCDEVVSRILDATFDSPTEGGKIPFIRYAVAGIKNSNRIHACINVIEDFFRRHPVARHPKLHYVGGGGLQFKLREWRHHKGPYGLISFLHGLCRQPKKKKQTERLLQQVNYLNKGFPYFTHNSFDFRPSEPFANPQFDRRAYIETVCRGVYRHLLERHETQMTVAGRNHRDSMGDLRWAMTRRRGNWAIRASAYWVRKGLRRACDAVTFDRQAFEEARNQVAEDSLMVVVPTHRSYLDFVICSYLFFAHPNLGIAIPHIAAAKEFAKIPILGWLFRQTHAFYVERGLGKENKELTRQVHDLVMRGESLEFFIEGTRSRSRQLLPPKRGMIKCLQSAKQHVTLLPVAISYDRVPEEVAFIRECKGGAKPGMRLYFLMKWLYQLLRGRIRLGQVHVTCGQPVHFDQHTDASQIGPGVMTELEKGLVTTTHHLQCFLAGNPDCRVSLDWLARAIEERGGRVLQSSLPVADNLDPILEKTMRFQWAHWFFGDALHYFGDHPVLLSYQKHVSFLKRDETHLAPGVDPKIPLLLQALFGPLFDDYRRVALALGMPPEKIPFESVRDVVRYDSNIFLPHAEACIGDLLRHGILVLDDNAGPLNWGLAAHEISAYAGSCEIFSESQTVRLKQ